MAQEVSSIAKGEKGRATARGSWGRVNRVLTAVEICILIGVMILFNLFPDKVGIYSSAVEPYVFVPLLTPEWLAHVPWLNVWWSLALALALVKLVYGRWTEALRWADLGVHVFSIFVLAGVILGYAFAGGDFAGVQQGASLMLLGLKSCIALVLVGQIAGLFSRLKRLGIAIPVLQWRIG